MPYAKSWTDLETSFLGGRMTLEGSPENIRAQYVDLIKLLLPLLADRPLSDKVESKDGEVDGVKYRVYNPKDQTGVPLPVAIWMHGGGYMVGDINSDDLFCRAIAEHTSSVVVNVDYRLAPEHKWPAQLDDCMAVYKWAVRNASSIGGDPKKFYTGGVSAGGGLALQIANRVVQDAELKDSLKGIIALVPLTCHWDHVPEEYRSMYKSHMENKTGAAVIDNGSMAIFYEHVGVDPKDPDAFVLLAKDNHKNFPPTYFASCEFDPLRDDSYVMEAALKKAGVPVKHDHYPGFPHCFWLFPQLTEGQQFVGNVMSAIGWLKSKM